MATIDIGKLTFTHKGDYNGSTAYVLNDVVYYNGSAYIAKTSTTGNLPTSTAHWNQFSAGSGGIWNSGLSIGTAGQVVKVNSGASALEFGTVSSDWVKINYTDSTSSVSSHEFQNIFDDSTYSAYKMFITTEVGNGVQHYGYFMNGSTSLNGSTDYYKAGVNGYRQTDNANNTAGPNSDGNGRPSMDLGNWGQSDASGVVTFNELTIFGPLASGRYRGVCSTMGQRDNSGTDYWVGAFVYYFYANNSNPIDGFRLDLSSGNFERLTFALYGIKK